MESPPCFAEEIDFNELHIIQIVGKGAFGVVSKARWRDKDVAVKLIETESERKAFLTELKQLSRVNHPNIVKLYGASTKAPVCLVMEYAEGGSLYNVLHGTNGEQAHYTAAHAMSWLLQCARGVEYLHSMKPKALIHRDLKPPNLLLIMRGTVLKICDFGTACDVQTHMTNNKGSAAWMAPEVFEGCNYSEKCDVFSWGIISWEVFTRRKPFDEIGGPAFRIMWAVHNGTRPPLIKNLPKPLELLMTRCWSSNAPERPSMSEVVRIMTHMFQFFKGAEEPLLYYSYDESGNPDYTRLTGTGMGMGTQPTAYQTPPITGESRGATIRDTVRHALGEPVPFHPSMPIHQGYMPPVVVEDDHPRGGISAPPSLAASRESLIDGRSPRSGTPVNPFKRHSTDLSRLEEYDIMSQGSSGSQGRGHRRVGSDEYYQVSAGSGSSTPRTSSPSPVRVINPHNNHMGGIHHVSTYPGSLSNSHTLGGSAPIQATEPSIPPNELSIPPAGRSVSWTPGVHVPIYGTGISGANADAMNAMNMVSLSLDHQLQPLAPAPNCEQSMAIYMEHCQLAEQYVRVQTEIALLIQRKHELIKEYEQAEKGVAQSTNQRAAEYTQLSTENESLMLLHKNLKKQVEHIRRQQQHKPRHDVTR